MTIIDRYLVNLIKLLYDDYNNRCIKDIPDAALYFELINSHNNLLKFMNIIVYETCQLNSIDYTELKHVEDVYTFMETHNYKFDRNSNIRLLEELLVQLMSLRIEHKSRLVKSLSIDDIKDDDMNLHDLNDEPPQVSFKEQPSESEFQHIKSIANKLSLEYEIKWQQQLDRFYSTIEAFIDMDNEKDRINVKVLLSVLSKWRDEVKFKRYEVYDLFTNKIEDSIVNIDELPIEDVSVRMTELYNKVVNGNGNEF